MRVDFNSVATKIVSLKEFTKINTDLQRKNMTGFERFRIFLTKQKSTWRAAREALSMMRDPYVQYQYAKRTPDGTTGFYTDVMTGENYINTRSIETMLLRVSPKFAKSVLAGKAMPAYEEKMLALRIEALKRCPDHTGNRNLQPSCGFKLIAKP